MTQTPPIRIGPIQAGRPPYRVVTIRGERAGKAYNWADVAEYARRAGWEDDLNPDDPAIEWTLDLPNEWGPTT